MTVQVQLSMVGLMVEDMPRALAFYRLLGLEIPAEDASLDFVYTINVLHHLPSVPAQHQAFGEILRVLRPGGRVVAFGGTGGGNFTTLAGVMKLFDSPGRATLGWTHYLAFDLFTGMWIARDADAKGFSRIVQFPFLFLTLMVGPVGLLAWLIVRERRARAQAKAA